MKQTTCKSCSRNIVWARTENRKPIPLDPRPSPGGNLLIVADDPDGTPVVRYVKKGGAGAKYVPHFATCPNATGHRKTKPQRAKARRAADGQAAYDAAMRGAR